MSALLLVVDPQVDFASQGKLPVPHTDQAIMRIANELIPDGDYEAIVATQDWHNPQRDAKHLKEWGVHCIENTPGAEFAGPLADFDFDQVLRKYHLAPDYMDRVIPKWKDAGIDRVDVVGTSLEYCVASTADAVKNNGMDNVRVLLHYVGYFGGVRARKAIAKLTQEGIEVV